MPARPTPRLQAFPAEDLAFRRFVADAFAHFKFIGYHGAAEPLLIKAGLDSADRGSGCLRLDAAQDVKGFLTACRELRFWQRELAMAKG